MHGKVTLECLWFTDKSQVYAVLGEKVVEGILISLEAFQVPCEDCEVTEGVEIRGWFTI